jgi:phytoene dehydrogenase-like protein
MRLCCDAQEHPIADKPGRISFVESILVLDRPPAELGHEATIVFYCDQERFTYAVPDDLVDLRSGVVCCPNNYDRHDDLPDGLFRLTCQANGALWADLDEQAYRAAKQAYQEQLIAKASEYIPGISEHIVYTDMFTPRTIERFTGHLGGAVYGTERKRRDGRTRLENLYICGTDQGFLGIIGAMLSGVTIANLQVLSRE